MSESASIRLATEADLPSIAALIHTSFIEYKSSYTDKGFVATTPSADQLAKRMAEGPIWIAVQDEVVLGTVSVVSRGDELYIRGMAVVPQARGLGLGELLLKTVQEFALAHGHKRLTLSTTPFLLRAIKLYTRFGFERTADGPHELFGTPLFTMVKQLK
ncbi:MAG TPA: GNAT family N-acetyltransferase [Pyrinomonadaceae bacterium]|nr:GNAT family N-acetyltransferase [Pyrinomonadaceae bacterium]